MDTTPTMSVIEALDITTCIPIVFKPVLYRDCLYVDGAVYNYLPTDIVTDKNTLVLYAPLLPKTDAPKNLYQFVREKVGSVEGPTRFAVMMMQRADGAYDVTLVIYDRLLGGKSELSRQSWGFVRESVFFACASLSSDFGSVFWCARAGRMRPMCGTRRPTRRSSP